MEQSINKQTVIKLSNYVRPEVKEMQGKDFVLNGAANSFYKYIISRYYGSPTNRAIIDAYGKFIYGKGITSDSAAINTVKAILSKNDLRAICVDYKLFGSATVELIYAGGKLRRIKHASRPQIAPEKYDKESGAIEHYYFCQDFSNLSKYKPVQIPAWKPAFLAETPKNGSYIYEIKTHQVGKNYYCDPDYMAGLQYAELEEEICNYFINHIKNGLSTGYILNMNGGVASDEVKMEFESQFKDGTTGSSNAGNIIVNWNSGKDTAIEAIPLQISDAHQQYSEINDQCTQKLLISHKVTNPILFGIKENTGLGNNADEMQVAFNMLMRNVIQPMQEVILDALMEVLKDAGISLNLEFLPFEQTTTQQPQTQQPIQMAAHDHTDPTFADMLIEMGESIDEQEWELVDEVPHDDSSALTETALNLAKTFSSFPSATSEQDTSLFKVRYKYSGNTNPQREFCAKMMGANKVYRIEDIRLAADKKVNPGLGPKGADTYSIELYKGGVNCRHFWLRQIYLRRNNKRIGVNEAKKMILALDPSERPAAKWEQNDPLMAQAASESNNYFRLS